VAAGRPLQLLVTYDPAKFAIAGQETLAYWNLSPDTLTELYFHLYLNAYRRDSRMARHDAAEENWRIQDLPGSAGAASGSTARES